MLINVINDIYFFRELVQEMFIGIRNNILDVFNSRKTLSRNSVVNPSLNEIFHLMVHLQYPILVYDGTIFVETREQVI